MFHDALNQLVILGVINEVESASRSYECKTTAKQHESAKTEIECPVSRQLLTLVSLSLYKVHVIFDNICRYSATRKDYIMCQTLMQRQRITML